MKRWKKYKTMLHVEGSRAGGGRSKARKENKVEVWQGREKKTGAARKEKRYKSTNCLKTTSAADPVPAPIPDTHGEP